MLITTMIKNNKNNTGIIIIIIIITIIIIILSLFHNYNDILILMLTTSTTLMLHLMHPIYIANLFLIHHGASPLLEDFLAIFLSTAEWYVSNGLTIFSTWTSEVLSSSLPWFNMYFVTCAEVVMLLPQIKLSSHLLVATLNFSLPIF